MPHRSTSPTHPPTTPPAIAATLVLASEDGPADPDCAVVEDALGGDNFTSLEDDALGNPAVADSIAADTLDDATRAAGKGYKLNPLLGNLGLLSA
jgi:hypothetical protein